MTAQTSFGKSVLASPEFWEDKDHSAARQRAGDKLDRAIYEVYRMSGAELRRHVEEAERAVQIARWNEDRAYFERPARPPRGKPIDTYGLELAKWGAW